MLQDNGKNVIKIDDSVFSDFKAHNQRAKNILKFIYFANCVISYNMVKYNQVRQYNPWMNKEENH